VRTILSLFLLASLTLKADNVLRELALPGMRQKAVELGPGLFSENYIEHLARTELAKRPRPRFIQLSLFGQNGGAPLPKPDHVAYDYWRTLYDALSINVITPETRYSAGYATYAKPRVTLLSTT
jgi:hypothetical protein